MQELARALGKRIRGMNRPSSLKRISDFLVEENLVEAPPADETVVIYRAPRMGVFTRTIMITAVILTLLSGAIGYYSWTKARASQRPAVPAILKTAPGTVSSPATTAVPSPPTVAPGAGGPAGKTD